MLFLHCTTAGIWSTQRVSSRVQAWLLPNIKNYFKQLQVVQTCEATSIELMLRTTFVGGCFCCIETGWIDVGFVSGVIGVVIVVRLWRFFLLCSLLCSWGVPQSFCVMLPLFLLISCCCYGDVWWLRNVVVVYVVGFAVAVMFDFVVCFPILLSHVVLVVVAFPLTMLSLLSFVVSTAAREYDKCWCLCFWFLRSLIMLTEFHSK